MTKFITLNSCADRDGNIVINPDHIIYIEPLPSGGASLSLAGCNVFIYVKESCEDIARMVEGDVTKALGMRDAATKQLNYGAYLPYSHSNHIDDVAAQLRGVYQDSALEPRYDSIWHTLFGRKG